MVVEDEDKTVEVTEDKNVEIDVDIDCMTVNFWDKGLQLFLMNDEAKELRDALIEALSV